MSWLYTLVYAGLLISNSSETNIQQQRAVTVPQAVVVQNGDDVIDRFEQTYPFTANGRVSVSNVNGSIVVEAWDRKEIRLEATKIADSQESMAMMDIVVDARPGAFAVKTDFKHWNYDSFSGKTRRKMEVQYRLQVPKGAVLDEIEAVNCAINVSNFSNVIRASAVNGTITATNLRGRIKLSTVNGTVKTDFDRVEPGTSVALETVNGRVHLELASDINATVKAETLNGGLINEFGLPVKKTQHIGRNLHGRLGSGEGRVVLTAINGNLSIIRKKDGKALGPVTDLIRADSEDEDSDGEFEVVSRATNKTISEAVRESNQAMEKAAKETQKAAEKIKAELPKIEMPNVELPKVEIRDKAVQKTVNDNIRSQRDAVRLMTPALWRNSPISIDQKTRSFTVKSSPKVTITAPKCKVFIRGWDQSTVKYVLTEPKRERQQPLSVVEDVGDKAVSLVITEGATSTRPFVGRGEDNVIRLEVFVPKKSDLKVSSEQEIRLQGVNGEIDLKGESEPISVRDSVGDLKLTSSDGLVRVVGFKGDLQLETSDSDVFLEGDFERIDSRAVDANITLTLPANKNASISTNSAIESEGLNIVRQDSRTWRVGNGGPKYDFEFVDGTLKLRSLSLIETN